MKNFVNWRIFFILLTLSLLSVVFIFPYVLTIQGDILKQVGQPVWMIFIAQFIQSIIMFSLVIFFGLRLTNKIGFKLPLFEEISKKGNYRKILNKILGKSFLAGAIVAVAIYLVDIIFTIQGAFITTHQNYAPVWQKLLASLYGGVTEEIIMRLFLMSFFIWIGMKLFKKDEPTTIGIIIPIILAAIIFGLGHLPVTAAMTAITPIVVLRAIVLNGIGGIVFGWLFWKKGLESAMIAHFVTDIFLLTLLPQIFN